MQIKHLIITLLLLSFIISPAIAAEDAITNFITIIPMPVNIVAGSTYQMEYSFTGTGSVDIEINFNITAPELTPVSTSAIPTVNFGDWYVFYVLNGVVITTTEEDPGHFTGTAPIVANNYELIIQFEPVPNVIPGEYGSIVTVRGEQIEVYYPPDDDNDNGGSSRRSTPTPLGTLAPTTVPTPIPTIIVHQTTDDNGTIEVIIIPDDPTNYWWYLLIPLFLILILVYLYWKKKSEEDKEGEDR